MEKRKQVCFYVLLIEPGFRGRIFEFLLGTILIINLLLPFLWCLYVLASIMNMERRKLAFLRTCYMLSIYATLFLLRQYWGELFFLFYSRASWDAKRWSYLPKGHVISGGTGFKSRAVQSPCSSSCSVLPWYCEASCPYQLLPPQCLYLTIAHFSGPSVCISSSNSAIALS